MEIYEECACCGKEIKLEKYEGKPICEDCRREDVIIDYEDL